MELSRRDFLKLSGVTAGGLLLGRLVLAQGVKPFPLHKRIGERPTICPFCAVGCGAIVGVTDGKVVNIEGDPDHPINRGSLCSKGSALYQVANNERRLRKVLYRAPGGTEWQEKTWDWALEEIAKRIKAARDASWVERDREGRLVNRTEGVACLGGAALDNEECALIVKAMRALGLVYIEHQARICHSSTVAALAESFGRGAMTNHWIDIKNADVIFIIGSNAAEQHPLSFKWVTQAMEKGAKLIVADPRFTRTAARADIYAKFRSGTDIALIGGLINYVLEHDLYHRDYVVQNTNASFLINPEFGFKDGLFSGYNAAQRSYDRSTWSYQLDGEGIPKRDETLQDPHCVFQLLKRHYARYDLETVSKITGTPREVLSLVYQTFGATGRPDRVGTIMYAMGTTQHTYATQMIRSYAILQLLLGNIGVAGGGINALRGESNVQGSTDHCMLFHILPGYLKAPQAEDETLAKYIEHYTPVSHDPKSANWWGNYSKYIVSLLKAWYGEAAKPENDFGYDWLPKASANYSHIALFEAMFAGTIKGLIIFGQNPAVGGPNVNMEREALKKLDWLMAADLWETETAAIWKAPGVNPEAVKTEVFLLPAAASFEKEGSITNSGRWSQWRWKAIDPPGEAKSDLWIINQLMLRLKRLYAREGGPNAEAIRGLAWNYGDDPDPHDVAKEINGYDLATGRLLDSFGQLKDDGSTSSANWLYCGSYTEAGNMAARRDNWDYHPAGIGLYARWAWAWPLNRRIIYNRASCDRSGRPWDPRRFVIRWTGQRWEGDVPDGGWPPGTKYNFIMKPEGHGRIFGMGLADGPFPEHYEPWESPVDNLLHPQVSIDPVFVIWASEMDYHGDRGKYPIVATTYRLTEHWQAGQMTRNLPWLVELQPEMFVEIGKELAAEKGIENGERVIVESARGSVEAVALVTERLQPFMINGRKVHEVGMPWHWGYIGLSTGDSANQLTPHVGDANTMIPEYKAFLCNIRKKGGS